MVFRPFLVGSVPIEKVHGRIIRSVKVEVVLRPDRAQSSSGRFGPLLEYKWAKKKPQMPKHLGQNH